MRTLKKSLSLVLVLAMVCSFFVMGTSAAFEDAADIDAKYVEAIEVMNALKILQGSEGNYNPQGTLTRAAAARIIVAMLGAEDIAKTAKCTFTDVPVGEWYYDEIAYCQSIGLMKGYGDGTVGPLDELTGEQFALMVMKAAGVDTKSVDPAAFELTVTALAAKVGFASIDELAADVYTREMAAQLAYNGLFHGTVVAEGYPVYLDGAIVGYYESLVEASIAAEQLDGTYGTKWAQKTANSLAEKNFKVARYIGVADSYGAPCNLYTKKGLPLLAVGYEADVTYSNQKVSQQDLVNDLGLGSYSSYYSVDVIVDGVASETEWAWGANATARSKSFIANIGLGSEVEVYLDADNYAITVVVVNPHFGTVSLVTKATETEDRFITIAGVGDFETESFAKDDDVLYTVGGEDIITVSALEKKSGKITKVTSAGVYTIDGVDYSAAIGVELEGWTTGTDVYFYVDTYGNVIGEWVKVDAYEKGDYILVLDNAEAKTALGSASATLDVYGFILGEDTVKTITFADALPGEGVEINEVSADELTVGGIYNYAVSTTTGANNFASLTANTLVSAGEIADGATSIVASDDETYIINNNTTFVFYHFDATKYCWVIEMFDGSAALDSDIDSGDAQLLVGTDDDDNAVVEYVVVAAEYAGDVADSKNVVYYSGKTTDRSSVTEGYGLNAKTTITYNVVTPAGEKTTVVEVNITPNTTEGIYLLKEDGTFGTKVGSAETAVTKVAGSTIYAGAYLALTADTIIVDLTLTGNGKIDVDDKIQYVVDADDASKLAVVFITDVVVEEEEEEEEPEDEVVTGTDDRYEDAYTAAGITTSFSGTEGTITVNKVKLQAFMAVPAYEELKTALTNNDEIYVGFNFVAPANANKAEAPVVYVVIDGGTAQLLTPDYDATTGVYREYFHLTEDDGSTICDTDGTGHVWNLFITWTDAEGESIIEEYTITSTVE